MPLFEPIAEAMPDKIHQVSPLQSPSNGFFILIFGWIFQKQAVAFLVPELKQQYTSRSSGSSNSLHHRISHRRSGGPYRLSSSSSSSSSLFGDRSDHCDTLETLSDLLSNLLSANKTDAHPTAESDLSQNRQRQRQLLTTRLSNVHDSEVDSKHIHINRTYVEKSTIVDAGQGLFVRKDCPEGTLLTCYPGDALVDLASNGDGVIDIDTNNNAEGRVTWGSHASSRTNATTMTNDEDDRDGDGKTNSKDDGFNKFALRQDYMLRAICDHWGIVAVPEILGDADPSYLGHFANDGAQHPPSCESELAAYVIESADKANAMHQPCEDCHMITVATRDLKAGEEIFVTYGPDYWREQQASFVLSSSSSSPSSSQVITVDEDHYDDGFDDQDFDDSDLDDDFDFDYYDTEAEAIVTDIISSLEESSESPSRGKGFG